MAATGDHGEETTNPAEKVPEKKAPDDVEMEEELINPGDPSDLGPKADEHGTYEKVLLNAAASEANARRDIHILRLEEKIADLERELVEEKSERKRSDVELKKLHDQLLKQKRKDEATKTREARRDTALDRARRGDDVRAPREYRTQLADARESRIVVTKESRIHPDHECEECGRRAVEDVMSKGPLTQGYMAKIKFSTIRQLGALMEITSEGGKKLPLMDVMNRMRDKADMKDVGIVAMKRAYRWGVCAHALDSAQEVEKTGVYVMDEEEGISDAISVALMRGGGRTSKKAYVMLVPKESIIPNLKGNWRVVEMIEYDDNDHLRDVMMGMENAGSFPRNLIATLKSSFTTENLKEIKKNVCEIVKKEEICIYILPDVVPTTENDLKMESLKIHHKFLNSWYLDNPPENLVLCCQLSATVWGGVPLALIFKLATKANKMMLEDALMHLIEGKSFEQPKQTVPRDVEKRPSTWDDKSDGGGSDISRGSDEKRRTMHVPHYKRCYICKKPDHLSWACPEKNKNKNTDCG